MILPESLVAFTIASALLALAPGPDNIFVLTQSTILGWKKGVLVTIGLCTGLIFHTFAVAFGVAAIFQASVLAFTILKTVGAAYLLYLAWQAFRASASRLDNEPTNQLSAVKLYRRGIIMNITNPKVSIFFLAFLPQFTSPANGSVAAQVMMLGLVFILMTLLVFSGVAMAAGSLGSVLNRSPKIQLCMNRIAGTVFIGLAFKLATASMDS
jgi:threonine/homoserine/homoserine lactone efflux protein